VPLTRGATMGPLAVPMAILSGAVLPFASLHYLLAPSPWFWLSAAVVLPAGWILLRRWEVKR